MARSTLALAAVLSVASTSLAGDLVTPPVYVGDSTNATCRLLNITSAPIPAQLELIDSNTGVMLLGSGSITVPAGIAVRLEFDHVNHVVYCRFVNVSKSKVRADMTTYVPAGDESNQVVVVAQ